MIERLHPTSGPTERTRGLVHAAHIVIVGGWLGLILAMLVPATMTSVDKPWTLRARLLTGRPAQALSAPPDGRRPRSGGSAQCLTVVRAAGGESR